MRRLKKIFKWLGLSLLALVLIGGAALLAIHEKRPTGRSGHEAEAMAEQMLQAVNLTAWNNLKIIQWTFRDDHHFVWDKEQDFVEVRWQDKRALIALSSDKYRCFDHGAMAQGSEAEALQKKASHLFHNDSFWMMAFTKVKDPGTVRELVELDDGEQALLVTYTTGGDTPGDSYLWQLDDSGRPKAWKMWVNIIPVGGMEYSWENWEQLPNGAWVALKHGGDLLDINLNNLKTGDSLSELGLDPDLFKALR